MITEWSAANIFGTRISLFDINLNEIYVHNIEFMFE